MSESRFVIKQLLKIVNISFLGPPIDKKDQKSRFLVNIQLFMILHRNKKIEKSNKSAQKTKHQRNILLVLVPFLIFFFSKKSHIYL